MSHKMLDSISLRKAPIKKANRSMKSKHFERKVIAVIKTKDLWFFRGSNHVYKKIPRFQES
jgi:hypothetical protein